MSGAPAIELKSVAFSHGGFSVLLDLTIDTASVAAIVGPSGSGKSTLLDLIAGFETAASGTVSIFGADVTQMPPSDRPVSMVFQDNNLFDHLDVIANIGLGRRPSLRLSSLDHDRISDAVARTGLAGKEKRLPAQLSGGERQRVALARALVRERPVLLLDEAFAGLGPALRHEMLDLVADLQERSAMTVLMVTHDPGDALRIATTTAFIDSGRIAAYGSTQELFSEAGPVELRRYLGETGSLSE